MKVILTRKNEEILVSDTDFEEVNKYTWFVDSKGYASTNVKAADRLRRQRRIRMHRLILPEAKIIDHINRNKLDNRRSNLREATISQNNINKKAASSKKASPYKGVHKTASGKWQAMIWHKGKNRGLGSFDSPEEAALVYNAAVKELHGEYAFLNDI